MVAYGTENMENMILVICMFCFTLWIIYNTVIYVYFCFVFKLKYIILFQTLSSIFLELHVLR